MRSAALVALLGPMLLAACGGAPIGTVAPPGNDAGDDTVADAPRAEAAPANTGTGGCNGPGCSGGGTGGAPGPGAGEGRM